MRRALIAVASASMFAGGLLVVSCTTEERPPVSQISSDATIDNHDKNDGAVPDGGDSGDGTVDPDGSSDDGGLDDGATDDGGSDDGGSDDGASQTDAGLTCLGGGSPIVPSGSGSCADPYVVTFAAANDIVTYVATNGADEAMSLGGPCTANTERDIVFKVTLPSGATNLRIAVDAVATVDTRIAVFEDPQCGQPVNQCALTAGPGECEDTTATKSTHFFGDTTYVSVSEVTKTNLPLTVRIQAF